MIFHSIFIQHEEFSIFYLYLEKTNFTITHITEYGHNNPVYSPKELKIFDWPEVLDGSLYTTSQKEGIRFLEILEKLKKKDFGKVIKLEEGKWCSAYVDQEYAITGLPEATSLKKDIIFYDDFHNMPDSDYARWIVERKTKLRKNFLLRKRKLLERFYSQRLWKFTCRFEELEL